MNGAIIREESREIATLRAVWVNVLAVVGLVVDPLAIDQHGGSTVWLSEMVEREVEGEGRGTDGVGWRSSLFAVVRRSCGLSDILAGNQGGNAHI